MKPIENLRVTFDNIMAAIRSDAVKQAALEAAELIRAEAEARAPVLTGHGPTSKRDPGVPIHPPGTLRDSIIAKQLRGASGDHVEVDIGPSRTPLDGWYGRLVEDGTAHSTGKPFLRPAFDEKSDEARQLFAERLAEIINGAAQ